MTDNPHLGQYGQPVYLSLCCSFTLPEVEALLRRKKAWGLERETLMAQQKQMGAAKDYEGAKALKPYIAELMQLQRAAGLFLGHLHTLPAPDCQHRPVNQWGAELAPACRVIDNLLLYSSALLEE